MPEPMRRLEQLGALFKTGNDQQIIARIAALREEEVFSGVIKLIAKLHEETGSDGIKSIISEFLNDIKDNTLAGEVIEAIDTTGSEETRRVLISSCWQSGIDYSNLIASFIEYSIKGNYMIALECYSVIEQEAYKVEDNIRIICLEKIRSSMKSQPAEKIKLLECTIRTLSYPADFKESIHYS
ncbi:MAG TPA: hypothetical protein VMW76_08810 [Bacteroidales bacterium]|nr:hypothetical protein [Bacteroidales bacterium]